VSDGDADASREAAAADEGDPRNDGQVFDRLPATAADRVVPGRPTRGEVLDWFDDRFGLGAATFEGYTFWEKGAGKVWAFASDLPADRVDVEGVGITLLRTRQEHWKPTTSAAVRFGAGATRNRIDLTPAEAAAFLRGDDRPIERWDGDWGYLIAAQGLAGEPTPIGVGLYLHGELRSVVPKGRREDLPPLPDG
jgi:NOL1/NOP2/fmu family ribosome biogenesis protein